MMARPSQTIVSCLSQLFGSVVWISCLSLHYLLPRFILRDVVLYLCTDPLSHNTQTPS